MATRRKKPTTPKRGSQGAKPKARFRKVKVSVPKRNARGQFVPKKGKPASAKLRQKASKPRSKAKGKGLSRKVAPQVAPKKRTAREAKSFEKLLTKAFKEDKLPVPTFPKRMGKSSLRGVDKTSKERSLLIDEYWEQVKTGWLEQNVKRIFASLFAKFKKTPPTMYARFSFVVHKVRTMLMAGSPKLLRATKGRIVAWHLSTGVSYTLPGVQFQFEKSLDAIDREIQSAEQENPGATFFLRYVTMVAYVLGH